MRPQIFQGTYCCTIYIGIIPGNFIEPLRRFWKLGVSDIKYRKQSQNHFQLKWVTGDALNNNVRLKRSLGKKKSRIIVFELEIK
jgi:hypothetical protein